MKLWQWITDKFDFDFYKNKVFQRVAWGIVVFIILATLVAVDLQQTDLKVGQVSDQDIKAPRTVTYIDKEATKKARDQAAASVSKVYEEDEAVISKVREKTVGFFDLIRKVKTKEIETEGEDSKLEIKRSRLQEASELQLTADRFEYLLDLSSEKLDSLAQNTIEILVSYLNRGVRSDDFIATREQMLEEVDQLYANPKYKQVIKSLSKQLLEPNLIYRRELTEEKRLAAREEIDPVTRTIRKGEIIIRHGRVVTEADIQKLEALGLRETEVQHLNIIGSLLVVLIIMLTIVIYIYQYQPSVLNNMGELALIGLLPIIILSLAKVAKYLPITYSSFVVPVAAAAILIAILLNTDLSIMVTIGLSFLVAMVSDESIIDLGVAVVSSFAGIYSVSELSQRGDLVRAGFIVGGVSSVTIFSFMLTNPMTIDWIPLLQIVPLGLVNGFIVAIVTNGLLPYVENIFGITSPVKLLELSNPNHPLLKRLLVEAPGTYHHSIIVGNLAEAAADKVGADSLLARVGAYYHDIGKIKRSYFFNENQIGAENPHDKLSPSLSTLIITSHVKDGVEMASEYKLPEIVTDIIKQHHGTSLVSFFYQEAVYDDKYKTVDEEEFRYDGPRPETKEAALVMLADMVEAAVRSNVSVQSNPDKLEKFVRDLIDKKLSDGQLNESDLTLKEIDKIVASFVNILKSIFHNRIDYPDNLAQEFKEGRGADENSN